MGVPTERRVRLIEQKLEHQQAEFERIDREEEDRAVGIVTRPCSECSDGWVVKRRNELVCPGCGYTYYF